MTGNRQVGGLWCNEVLAGLSGYLDGDLAPELAAKVEAHVSACTNCSRFGTGIAAMLQAVARQRQEQGELPGEVAARLRVAVLGERSGSG